MFYINKARVIQPSISATNLLIPVDCLFLIEPIDISLLLCIRFTLLEGTFIIDFGL